MSLPVLSNLLGLLELSLQLVEPPLGIPAYAALSLSPLAFLAELLLDLQVSYALLLELFR